MNQLETNLVLWAICSILLFEILIIICLCRACFNRIKPKRFYVKVNGTSSMDDHFKAFFQREEYEYLQGTHSGTSSKYQSTILRPPHADELALIGTIRASQAPLDYGHGIQNHAFSRERDDERTPSMQSPHWIELQPAIIHSALPPPPPLPAVDYEVNSDDYLSPQSLQSTTLDFHPYHSEDNLSNFRFQPLRRPELILPQVQRVDTSTESPGVNYSTIVPKSILKGSTNSTPPLDLHSTQPSRASSKYDESPRTFVRINPEPSIVMDASNSPMEKRVSMTSESRRRMQFANVSQLNEVEWDTPRDLQRVRYNSANETPRSQPEETSFNPQGIVPSTVDQHLHISRVFVPWQRRLNADPSFDDQLTQQKAFEYWSNPSTETVFSFCCPSSHLIRHSNWFGSDNRPIFPPRVNICGSVFMCDTCLVECSLAYTISTYIYVWSLKYIKECMINDCIKFLYFFSLGLDRRSFVSFLRSKLICFLSLPCLFMNPQYFDDKQRIVIVYEHWSTNGSSLHDRWQLIRTRSEKERESDTSKARSNKQPTQGERQPELIEDYENIILSADTSIFLSKWIPMLCRWNITDRNHGRHLSSTRTIPMAKTSSRFDTSVFLHARVMPGQLDVERELKSNVWKEQSINHRHSLKYGGSRNSICVLR